MMRTKARARRGRGRLLAFLRSCPLLPCSFLPRPCLVLSPSWMRGFFLCKSRLVNGGRIMGFLTCGRCPRDRDMPECDTVSYSVFPPRQNQIVNACSSLQPNCCHALASSPTTQRMSPILHESKANVGMKKKRRSHQGALYEHCCWYWYRTRGGLRLCCILSPCISSTLGTDPPLWAVTRFTYEKTLFASLLSLFAFYHSLDTTRTDHYRQQTTSYSYTYLHTRIDSGSQMGEVKQTKRD